MITLKEPLKHTFVYRNIYVPIITARTRRNIARRRTCFKEGAEELLRKFVTCMDEHDITYWLEFGTLLGAYRDHEFIPNDFDLDVGTYLENANIVYCSLTNNGFRLVREFHVVGENGLEQTYEYKGVTIDVMYFFKKENNLWCNGVTLPPRRKWEKVTTTMVTAHWFSPFGTTTILFKGLNVKVPDNTESHLIEIFGTGYKVYDPDFKGDLNKTRYPLSEKTAIGFVYY